MFAQFETTVGLPALKDGFVLAEIEVRVTVKGDIEGIAVDGSTEWDFVITELEGYAYKSAVEAEYQEIEKGSYLHTILTGELEKLSDFNEQAEEALGIALLDQRHAAE